MSSFSATDQYQLRPQLKKMSVLSLQLLFTVLAGTLAASSGHEIINGKKARDGTLKYMASVQINGSHWCGGFLIDPNFVLTAAHCDLSGEMTVVLGTHSIKGDIKRHKVRKIKHELFKNSGSGNDIMLLKLRGNKKTGKDMTVKLPSLDETTKTSTKCLVAGWGFTKGRQKTTKDLQVVTVKTIAQDECRDQWRGKKVNLPENIICAGGYKTNMGACQGDSGGPLVCNDVAIGIVSFNYERNCDYPNVPNVFTYISKFVPWIKKNMKANS